MGMKSLAKDLNSEIQIIMHSDASAGRSMAFRKGLGRVRHLETKYLWIQDLIKDGKIQLRKIKGTSNPADIGTKHLTFNEMNGLMVGIGQHIVQRGSRSCS